MVRVLALAVLAGFTMAQDSGVSPRTLFMSTAGSQVNTSPKPESLSSQMQKMQEDIALAKAQSAEALAKQESSKTEASKAETSKTETLSQKRAKPAKVAKSNLYLGMNVQVYVPTATGMRPVNPLSYTFKTGDTFKVMAVYNTTGVVEFINVDPLGQVSYLGSWVIDKPFSGTMLPKEGWFRFTGVKGNEKLIVRFFPCQVYDKKVVEEFNSASSRAIQVVPDAVQVQQVNLPELPVCNYEQFQKRTINQSDIASSRGIIVSEERTEKKLYYLTSYSNFIASNEPIVAVLTLRHR